MVTAPQITLSVMYCPTCGSQADVEVVGGGDEGVCYNCMVAWTIERMDDE